MDKIHRKNALENMPMLRRIMKENKNLDPEKATVEVLKK